MEISDSKEKYECSRHGPHNATMHIIIGDILKRVYCVYCYVEVLDKLGVKEMDLIVKGKS